jgi:geranylgeranylglycerol-phosphate geranylgeranyltransferase
MLGSVLFALPPLLPLIGILLSYALITASVFVINQYFDSEDDKCNPLKMKLPLAAQKISKRTTLALFGLLIFLGLLAVTVTDPSLFILLFLYAVGGVCYSAPPICFKRRPLLDAIYVGIGAGVFPFILGLQVSHQLTLEFNLFWIVRRYQDAFFAAVPIFLLQFGSHILHTVGDYDADWERQVNTFAVRYGTERSRKVGITVIGAALVLPIVYGLLNLSLANMFLTWYLLVFLLGLPLIVYLMRVLFRGNVKAFADVSGRFGLVVLFLLSVFLYALRIFGMI